MGAWLQAYEKLDDAQKDRVQRWLHLNKFIARALRLDWDDWVSAYLQPAMDRPLDYSFMADCVPDFAGFDHVGQGATFSKHVDPATAQTARVPVRAANSLGRLSPAAQDGIAALLEAAETAGEPDPVDVGPGDVVHLQKVFRREKALGRLQRKDFRRVQVAREGNEVVVRVQDGDELCRMSVLEFGAEMRRALV